MQTAWRTRDSTSRSRPVDDMESSTEATYEDISPVWEVMPKGHEELGPRWTVMHRDALLRRALAFVDVVATFAALFAVIRFIDSGQVHLRPVVLLVIPFVLLAGKVIGLYDRDANVLRKTTIDEAPSIFYLAVIYSLGVWLCETVLFRGFLARPQVLGMVMATFLLDLLGRTLARKLVFAFTSPERCIVVRDADETLGIAGKR
jgi:hypothetical protein